jgi:signal peptidase I
VDSRSSDATNAAPATDEVAGRWPWRQFHAWGVVCVVLAACAAFLFPAAPLAGTATPRDRVATAATLLVLGLVLLALRGTSPKAARTSLLVVVVAMLLGMATGLIHAIWIGALYGLIVMHVAAAPLMHRVWHRFFPAEPDRDEEATTDVIESIATAFILALVVREFAFEAFKIPTGSMEPTIYGEGGHSRKGDRLLAAKAPLLFDEPKRWSIVVFKFPLFRQTNFIKRLVGLPGEHVERREGDIYVNGKIVPKPDEVQESLWRPIVPDESGKWPGEGVKDSFVADDGGQWTFEVDAATCTAGADKTGWISHDETDPDGSQRDVRASFDVDASKLGDGAVLVRIDGGKRRVELEARRDKMWLSGPGIGGAEGPQKRELDIGGLGASTSRLAFSVADRVVRIYRGGRLVCRVETADAPNTTSAADKTWIGVTGGTARLSAIRLERDLQYAHYPGMPDAWDVPAGCYFMLGDNTTQSRDSRAWKGRVFRFKNGAPQVVVDVDSVRLDDERLTPSMRDLGDAFEVFDSYGVHRRIAKADLVGGTWTEENAPFVKREDLVGRAFLIFFPFPPFGDWRPRLLP